MEYKEMLLSDTIDMMLSDDYKERFKAEYYQLTVRIDRLREFVLAIESALAEGNTPPKHGCPLGVLEHQLNEMQAYQRALKTRAEYEKIDL